MFNPNETHFKALKHIWQYLKSIINLGILYKQNNNPELYGYVNSN